MADLPKAGKAFRALAWLNRPHSAWTRGALVIVGFGAVLAMTGRRALAGEVAHLIGADQIKLAAHRINFYLHHSWTAPLTRRTPYFDPTTGMEDATVAVLDDWLGHVPRDRDRLARMSILAHQIRGADADSQPALLDRYTDVAQGLMPAFPAANPAARPDPGHDFSLSDAKAALQSLAVIPDPWFILSGTFLGAVREGTFLAHDYDVDIGIMAEDFDQDRMLAAIHAAPDLQYVNQSPALSLNWQDGRWQCVSTPALYRVLHITGIGIDIFIHHLDGDLRWHGSARHRWDNSDFDLADITIAGLPVRGPADADRYLTENYGGWRIPVTSFSCSTGTPNVSFPYNPSSIAEMMRTATQSKGSAESETARLVLEQEGYVRDGQFTLPWHKARVGA